MPLRAAMGPYRVVVANTWSGWVVAAPAGAARGRTARRVREDTSGEVGGVVVRVGARAKGQLRRFADVENRDLRRRWVGSPPRSVLGRAAPRVLRR